VPFLRRAKGPYQQGALLSSFELMNPVDTFATNVFDHFDHIDRTIFAGDPAANDRLRVEITAKSLALDTPVLILLAPWTLCGLAQPPDGNLEVNLKVGHSHYPALKNDVASIGPYWSVLLVPDVSGYESQDEARSAADRLFEPFRSAVEKIRAESTEVKDESRRALLKGHTPAARERSNPFGMPLPEVGE
jgi:hypothetical protein